MQSLIEKLISDQLVTYFFLLRNSKLHHSVLKSQSTLLSQRTPLPELLLAHLLNIYIQYYPPIYVQISHVFPFLGFFDRRQHKFAIYNLYEGRGKRLISALDVFLVDFKSLTQQKYWQEQTIHAHFQCWDRWLFG